MNDTLSERLAEHWTISAQLLGWSPDEFWRSTPSEFHDALSRPVDQQSRGPTRAEVLTMMEREFHE